VKLEEPTPRKWGPCFPRYGRICTLVRDRERDGEENIKGHRALAIVRLLGLFDRPATADCLSALLKTPVILGMTEAVVG